MRLQTVYTRFYRAFNFDYLRASAPDPTPDPWDTTHDERFRPYIHVKIDPEMTCIVGANESGKSQLLDAIEFASGTSEPDDADFCRYSDYFTVVTAPQQPHFGLRFSDLRPDESQRLSDVLEAPETSSTSSFSVFRTEPGAAKVYIDGQSYDTSDVMGLHEIYPRVVRIDPDIALPNSVPLEYLANANPEAVIAAGTARHLWRNAISPALDNATSILPLLDDPTALADRMKQLFGLSPASEGMSSAEQQRLSAEIRLAYDLLITVGGIDPGAFDSLRKALARENEGLANGIIGEMNNQLEASLNLARWWTQDSDFRLTIDVREFHLVFTVRDKTGSNYSFGERSGGLKYFLSYLVQALAHMKRRQGTEILLMDEPDAYLSNQGQQDLLRVLREFTIHTQDDRGGQVVFVTHSPFLIDKNRADRLRVLDKGSGEEGVRVVHDVGHNRFEPLRTAMGSFVGETVFMGNCNIIVEGVADQVYLAGMSTLLSAEGLSYDECLDLNHVTLVPAGGAPGNVPYMTYLARGRGVDKPAVVVLLDGDSGGNDAIKELERAPTGKRRLLKSEYILQIKQDRMPELMSDRTGGPLSIEDLIPLDVALKAMRSYADEVVMDVTADETIRESVQESLSAADSGDLFEALRQALSNSGSELRIEKFPFARHVIAVVKDAGPDWEPGKEMRSRFAALFRYLTAIQRQAERERDTRTIVRRVEREKSRFLRDHLAPTKSDLKILLERIEAVVDEEEEGERLLNSIRGMRRDFQLSQDLNQPIQDIDELKSRLQTLQYDELRASQDPRHESDGP